MKTLQQPRPTLDDLIAEFFTGVGGSAATIQRYPITRLQEHAAWPEWANHPGVYCFEHQGQVVYVGRALRASLRDRLHTQCTADADPQWAAVIRDTTTIVGVVAFPPARWYLAAALEAMLIDQLRPTHNQRIA